MSRIEPLHVLLTDVVVCFVLLSFPFVESHQSTLRYYWYYSQTTSILYNLILFFTLPVRYL
jgi:hypothetical protein